MYATAATIVLFVCQVALSIAGTSTINTYTSETGESMYTTALSCSYSTLYMSYPYNNIRTSYQLTGDKKCCYLEDTRHKCCLQTDSKDGTQTCKCDPSVTCGATTTTTTTVPTTTTTTTAPTTTTTLPTTTTRTTPATTTTRTTTRATVPTTKTTTTVPTTTSTTTVPTTTSTTTVPTTTSTTTVPTTASTTTVPTTTTSTTVPTTTTTRPTTTTTRPTTTTTRPTTTTTRPTTTTTRPTTTTTTPTTTTTTPTTTTTTPTTTTTTPTTTTTTPTTTTTTPTTTTTTPTTTTTTPTTTTTRATTTTTRPTTTKTTTKATTTKTTTKATTTTTRPTTTTTRTTTTTASKALCRSTFRVLNGAAAASDCLNSGIFNITLPDGSTSSCNGAYTHATVNGAYKPTILTAEICKQFAESATDPESAFLIHIEGKTYKILPPMFTLVSGPDGTAFFDVAQNESSILDGVGACQENVRCPYNKNTMQGRVDWTNCTIYSWGVSNADEFSQNGLNKVALTSNEGGCQDVADPAIPGSLCFKTTSGKNLACGNDHGAPVYCKAIETEEQIFVGVAGLQTQCDESPNISVLPHPV